LGRDSRGHCFRPPAAGGDGYRRRRDLPRLIRVSSRELDASGVADLAGIVSRLRDALRGERQRMLTRHWAYDFTRHSALLRAHTAELRTLRLAELAAAARVPGHQPRDA
jgi:hypothetical protein